MGKAKVGKRGSVVIPAELRRHHHLKVGTPVMIEDHPDGVLIRAASSTPSRKEPHRKRFSSEERRRFFAQVEEDLSAWTVSDWEVELAERGVTGRMLMDGLTDECPQRGPQAHHMVPRGHTEDCPQARHMVEREAALPAEDFGKDRFAAEDTKQVLLGHGALSHETAKHFQEHQDNRTIALRRLKARWQSEATSVSQTTIDSSPYKEGRAVFGAGSLPSLGRKIAGSEVGHYQDANRDDGPHQSQCTTGSLSELEQGRNLGLEEIRSTQTLDELENRFMQVTIELPKEQYAEEDKENM